MKVIVISIVVLAIFIAANCTWAATWGKQHPDPIVAAGEVSYFQFWAILSAVASYAAYKPWSWIGTLVVAFVALTTGVFYVRLRRQPERTGWAIRNGLFDAGAVLAWGVAVMLLR